MRGEPCFTVPFSPTPKLHLTSQYQTSLKFATVAEPCPMKVSCIAVFWITVFG
jgi:hypothetical protein